MHEGVGLEEARRSEISSFPQVTHLSSDLSIVLFSTVRYRIRTTAWSHCLSVYALQALFYLYGFVLSVGFVLHWLERTTDFVFYGRPSHGILARYKPQAVVYHEGSCRICRKEW